ncbi:MAG: AAA family ATPase [Clostridia bacterium]|nr:AAA family ATPase [Clostridia bacterium]MBQ7090888.1 AAA family ATPase [Clostridia bacterium]
MLICLKEIAGRKASAPPLPQVAALYERLELDRQHPHHLITLAARPEMGKTTVALALAAEAAKRGEAVAIFSLELLAEQVASRLQNLHDPAAEQNLFVDDGGWEITVDDLQKSLEQCKKVGLIVVDYAELLRSNGNYASRLEENTHVVRELALLTRRLKTPVLVLSRLPRGDAPPTLEDVRFSGALEQDSDIVLLLHENKIKFAKNRYGDCGIFNLKGCKHGSV